MLHKGEGEDRERDGAEQSRPPRHTQDHFVTLAARVDDESRGSRLACYKGDVFPSAFSYLLGFLGTSWVISTQLPTTTHYVYLVRVQCRGGCGAARWRCVHIYMPIYKWIIRPRATRGKLPFQARLGRGGDGREKRVGGGHGADKTAMLARMRTA